MSFEPVTADTTPVKVWLGIYGPTGSGKTTGAVFAMRGLCGTEKFAMLNTERFGVRGVRKLDPNFDQQIIDPEEGYHPQKLIDAIHAAARGGYAGIIIDNLTDFWEGNNGLSQMAWEAGGRRADIPAGAWRVVAQWCDKILAAVRESNIHCIFTAHGRDKIKIVKKAGGGTDVIPAGVQPRVREQLLEKLFFIVEVEERTYNARLAKNRIGIPELPQGPITPQTFAGLQRWMNENPDVVADKVAVIEAKGGITLTVEKLEARTNGLLVFGANEIVVFTGNGWKDGPFVKGDHLKFPDAQRKGNHASGGREYPLFTAQQFDPVIGGEG